MTKLRSVTGLVVLVWLTWLAPAHANVVSDWNVVILQYVSDDSRRHPAISAGRGVRVDYRHRPCQAAVHDAVQAIEGKFQPCHYSDPSKWGIGSVEAAVAAAAHRVLVLLYPGQQGALDAFLHQLPDN